MATFTEVRFAHEDGALADTLEALPAVDVQVLPETSTNPSQVMYVLKFDNADADSIEDALNRDHTVRAVRSMPEFEERNLWGVEFTQETKLLAPRVSRDGGFVVDARSSSADQGVRGWHEQWLLPDREAVHDIWQYAQAEGFVFEVIDLHRQHGAATEYPVRDALTDEQRIALCAAYERGYFDEPREASLEAVADALGYSPSAVSGRIKRGMKSLIETTLAATDTRQ